MPKWLNSSQPYVQHLQPFALAQNLAHFLIMTAVTPSKFGENQIVGNSGTTEQNKFGTVYLFNKQFSIFHMYVTTICPMWDILVRVSFSLLVERFLYVSPPESGLRVLRIVRLRAAKTMQQKSRVLIMLVPITSTH